MNNHPTGREIARHLGVHPSRVSQLRREGLPVDSLEAAERWYRANVDMVRSIGNRLSRGAPVPKWAADRGAEAQHDSALERAGALGTAAHYALEAGAFEQIEPELRAALRAVPIADRSRLKLPEDVFDALCADVLADIKAHEKPGDFTDAAIPPEDVEWLADFWFRVAAGELVPGARR